MISEQIGTWVSGVEIEWTTVIGARNYEGCTIRKSAPNKTDKLYLNDQILNPCHRRGMSMFYLFTEMVQLKVMKFEFGVLGDYVFISTLFTHIP